MQHAQKIAIPNAAFLETIPLNRRLFYFCLLGAIGDRASELRYESGGGFGKVRFKVEENEYEGVPLPREKVEKMLRNLAKLPSGSNFDQVAFQLEVCGKLTEVLASNQPGALVFSFLNPAVASKEASEILNTVCQNRIGGKGNADLFLEEE